MARGKAKETKSDENMLKEAILALSAEKHISVDKLFSNLENALITACKNNFGKTDNIFVHVDRDAFTYEIVAEKKVVSSADEVEDPQHQITAADALAAHIENPVPGENVRVQLDSRQFGRIAAQIAKNVTLQSIREEERDQMYEYVQSYARSVVMGTVERQIGMNYSVTIMPDIRRMTPETPEGVIIEGILNEKDQIPGENLRPGQHIHVYVEDVKKTQKGATRIILSRKHPELVKYLFEEEVAEIRDGIVKIMAIAREAGSRTKIAVASTNPGVDPVGACVGLNGSRINTIVEELGGEKIDIITWDENPGNLIQNALSPAKVISVFADPEEKSAKVVVPDYQLSLAIGREGQNARLAARLTGYKIDIKSETQAKDAPGFRYEDYLDGDEEVIEYVDENGNPVDADGNPIDPSEIIEYVDENGNPVDENGNPIGAGTDGEEPAEQEEAEGAGDAPEDPEQE